MAQIELKVTIISNDGYGSGLFGGGIYGITEDNYEYIICKFDGKIDEEYVKYSFKSERSINGTAYSEHIRAYKKLNINIEHIDDENYKILKVIFNKFNNFSVESKSESIYVKNALFTSDSLSLKKNIDIIDNVYYRTGNLVVEEI